jgi:hypothetical protein
VPERIVELLGQRWEAIATAGAAVASFLSGAGAVWLRGRLNTSDSPAPLSESWKRIEGGVARVEATLVSIGERVRSLDEAFQDGDPSLVEKMSAVWTWTGERGLDDTHVSRLSSQRLLLEDMRVVVGQLAAVSTQHFELVREIPKLIAQMSGQQSHILEEIRDALKEKE